jgi:hypothetical protein
MRPCGSSPKGCGHAITDLTVLVDRIDVGVTEHSQPRGIRTAETFVLANEPKGRCREERRKKLSASNPRVKVTTLHSTRAGKGDADRRAHQRKDPTDRASSTQV